MVPITRKTVGPAIKRLLGWALLALALWGGFAGAARLAALWQTPSLRWQQPVSWRQALRLYEQGEAALSRAPLGEEGLPRAFQTPAVCPTFWQEEQTRVSTPRTGADAAVVWVLGRAALAWPAECLTGALPGRYDTEGCAVSEGLALRLFGSADAVGQTLRAVNKTYTVRGVFSGREARLVANAGVGQSFECAELTGPAGPDDLSAWPDLEAAARSWASGAGLAAPDTILCGPGLAWLARAAAALPLAAAFVLLAAALWRALRRCPAPAPQLAGWGLVFTAAGGLPLLAARLPGWLRPGRWSDTGFWQGVLVRIAGQARALLALAPTGKDLLAKQCLLFTFAAALAGLWLAAALAPREGPRRA